METVIDKEYPDNQTAEIDKEINGDLVNTRGEEDEPVNADQ